MTDDNTISTKPILVEVELEKKLAFQKCLKHKKQFMKDVINLWIDLYLQGELFSKAEILDYIALTFHSLINSKQIDEEVYDMFLKQLKDNFVMFSPEHVKKAISNIKELDLS